MKIPTITREAIEQVATGIDAGTADSLRFIREQPELIALADRVFGPGPHMAKAAYQAGMTVALRALEEMKEPS